MRAPALVLLVSALFAGAVLATTTKLTDCQDKHTSVDGRVVFTAIECRVTGTTNSLYSVPEDAYTLEAKGYQNGQSVDWQQLSIGADGGAEWGSSFGASFKGVYISTIAKPDRHVIAMPASNSCPTVTAGVHSKQLTLLQSGAPYQCQYENLYEIIILHTPLDSNNRVTDFKICNSNSFSQYNLFGTSCIQFNYVYENNPSSYPGPGYSYTYFAYAGNLNNLVPDHNNPSVTVTLDAQSFKRSQISSNGAIAPCWCTEQPVVSKQISFGNGTTWAGAEMWRALGDPNLAVVRCAFASRAANAGTPSCDNNNNAGYTYTVWMAHPRKMALTTTITASSTFGPGELQFKIASASCSGCESLWVGPSGISAPLPFSNFQAIDSTGNGNTYNTLTRSYPMSQSPTSNPLTDGSTIKYNYATVTQSVSDLWVPIRVSSGSRVDSATGSSAPLQTALTQPPNNLPVTVKLEFLYNNCNEYTHCPFKLTVQKVPSTNPTAYLSASIIVRVTFPTTVTHNGVTHTLTGQLGHQDMTLTAGFDSTVSGNFIATNTYLAGNWNFQPASLTLQTSGLSFAVSFDAMPSISIHDVLLQGIMNVCPAHASGCSVVVSDLVSNGWANYMPATAKEIVLTNWPTALDATVDLPPLTATNALNWIKCADATNRCSVRKWNITVPEVVSGNYGGWSSFIIEDLVQSGAAESAINIEFGNSNLILRDLHVEGGTFKITTTRTKKDANNYAFITLFFIGQTSTAANGNIQGYFDQTVDFISTGWVEMFTTSRTLSLLDAAQQTIHYNVPSGTFNFAGCNSYFKGKLGGTVYTRGTPVINSYIALRKPDQTQQGFHHLIGTGCGENAWDFVPTAYSEGYTVFVNHVSFGGNGQGIGGPDESSRWVSAFQLPTLDIGVQAGQEIVPWYSHDRFAKTNSTASSWFSNAFTLRITNNAPPPNNAGLGPSQFTTSGNVQPVYTIDTQPFQSASALGYDTLNVYNFPVSEFYTNREGWCNTKCGSQKHWTGLQCSCWTERQATVQYNFQHSTEQANRCEDVNGWTSIGGLCQQTCPSADVTRAPDNRCFCGASSWNQCNYGSCVTNFEVAANVKPSWATGVCGTDSPYKHVTLTLQPNPQYYTNSAPEYATVQLPLQPDHKVSASVSKQTLILDEGDSSTTITVNLLNFNDATPETNALNEPLRVQFAMSGNLTGFSFSSGAYNSSGNTFDVEVGATEQSGQVTLTASAVPFGKVEVLHVQMLPRTGIITPEGITSFTIMVMRTALVPLLNVVIPQQCNFNSVCVVQINRTDIDPVSKSTAVVATVDLSSDFAEAFGMSSASPTVHLTADTGLHSVNFSIPENIYNEDSSYPMFSVNVTASTNVLYEHQSAETVINPASVTAATGTASSPVKFCDNTVISAFKNFRRLCSFVTVSAMASAGNFEHIDVMSHTPVDVGAFSGVVWGGSENRFLTTVAVNATSSNILGPISYDGTATFTVSDSSVLGRESSSSYQVGVFKVENGHMRIRDSNATCRCTGCKSMVGISQSGSFETEGSTRLVASSSVYSCRSLFEIGPNVNGNSQTWLTLTPSSIENWAIHGALISLNGGSGVLVNISHASLSPPIAKPLATYSVGQGNQGSLSILNVNITSNGQALSGRTFYWAHQLLSAATPGYIDVSGSEYIIDKVLYALSTGIKMTAPTGATIPVAQSWGLSGTFMLHGGTFSFASGDNSINKGLPIVVSGTTTLQGDVETNAPQLSATGSTTIKNTVTLSAETSVSLQGALSVSDDGGAPLMFNNKATLDFSNLSVSVSDVNPLSYPTSNRVLMQLSGSHYAETTIKNAGHLSGLPAGFGIYAVSGWGSVGSNLKTNFHSQTVLDNQLKTITTNAGVVLSRNTSLENILYTGSGTDIELESGAYQNITIADGATLSVASGHNVFLVIASLESCTVTVANGSVLHFLGQSSAFTSVSFIGEGTVQFDSGLLQLVSTTFTGVSVQLEPGSAVVSTGSSGDLFNNAPTLTCSHASLSAIRFGSVQNMHINYCSLYKTGFVSGQDIVPAILCTGDSLVFANSHFEIQSSAMSVPFLQHTSARHNYIHNNTFHEASSQPTNANSALKNVGLNIGMNQDMNMTITSNRFTRVFDLNFAGNIGLITFFSTTTPQAEATDHTVLRLAGNSIAAACVSSIDAYRGSGGNKPGCTTTVGIYMDNIHSSYNYEFVKYALAQNITLGSCSSPSLYLRAISMLNPQIKGTTFDVYTASETCNDQCQCPIVTTAAATTLAPTIAPTAAPTAEPPVTTQVPTTTALPAPTTTSVAVTAPPSVVPVVPSNGSLVAPTNTQISIASLESVNNELRVKLWVAQRSSQIKAELITFGPLLDVSSSWSTQLSKHSQCAGGAGSLGFTPNGWLVTHGHTQIWNGLSISGMTLYEASFSPTELAQCASERGINGIPCAGSDELKIRRRYNGFDYCDDGVRVCAGLLSHDQCVSYTTKLTSYQFLNVSDTPEVANVNSWSFKVNHYGSGQLYVQQYKSSFSLQGHTVHSELSDVLVSKYTNQDLGIQFTVKTTPSENMPLRLEWPFITMNLHNGKEYRWTPLLKSFGCIDQSNNILCVQNFVFLAYTAGIFPEKIQGNMTLRAFAVPATNVASHDYVYYQTVSLTANIDHLVPDSGASSKDSKLDEHKSHWREFIISISAVAGFFVLVIVAIVVKNAMTKPDASNYSILEEPNASSGTRLSGLLGNNSGLG